TLEVLPGSQLAYNCPDPVKGPEIKQITRYDAFSAKVARSKLAFAGDDARARHFWCRSHLQRDFHAHRRVRSGFLAKAGELGGCRCVRVYGDKFDPLPLDPLGRVADVSGRHRLSDPDEVYRHQSLWGA